MIGRMIFDQLAEAIRAHGKDGMAPEIVFWLMELEAEAVDHSNAANKIEEYTIYTEDGLITLTYGWYEGLPGDEDRGFTLHRYRLEQSGHFGADGQTQDGPSREKTEDHVDAALKDAYFGDALAGIDRAVLLEFHNRMLDVKLGIEPDAIGVALLAEEAPTKH